MIIQSWSNKLNLTIESSDWDWPSQKRRFQCQEQPFVVRVATVHPLFQEKNITFESQQIVFQTQWIYQLFQWHLPINWAHLKLEKVRYHINTFSKLKPSSVSLSFSFKSLGEFLVLHLCNQSLRGNLNIKTCIYTLVGEISYNYYIGCNPTPTKCTSFKWY